MWDLSKWERDNLPKSTPTSSSNNNNNNNTASDNEKDKDKDLPPPPTERQYLDDAALKPLTVAPQKMEPNTSNDNSNTNNANTNENENANDNTNTNDNINNNNNDPNPPEPANPYDDDGVEFMWIAGPPVVPGSNPPLGSSSASNKYRITSQNQYLLRAVDAHRGAVIWTLKCSVNKVWIDIDRDR